MNLPDLDVVVDGVPCTYKYNTSGRVSEVVAGPFVEGGKTVSISLSPALDPPQVPGQITSELVWRTQEHKGLAPDRQHPVKVVDAVDEAAMARVLAEARQNTVDDPAHDPASDVEPQAAA